MKMLTYPVVLLLFLALSGCATQGSLDATRNDVDTLKTRIISLERELGGTREESVERLGAFEKSNQADVAAVRKLLADFQARSQSTREELNTLNARMDEMRQFREDADKSIISLQDSIAKLQAANDTLSKQIAGLAQQENEFVVSSPEALYNKGLKTYKSGDMPSSRKLFRKFIELYPHHVLASNALYWIGESYYSEKNYDQAILSFQDMIKKYPRNEKTPAAMLEQAMAFKEHQ